MTPHRTLPDTHLAQRRLERGPGLRHTWLFGAGADGKIHQAMALSGADVLIQDLEDFTPPQLRARVRINPLESLGYVDLQAVMPARPDIVAYPKAASAFHIRALDVAIATHEAALGIQRGADDARLSRRLGYRTKSLVRAEHVAPVRAALVPSSAQLDQARRIVAAFEAARGRGEERALVDGLWVEVPTYLNAQRLLAANH